MSQQINLFNPDLLKQKKHFSATAMAQGLGLILLGSIAVLGYAQWQLDGLERNTSETEKQLSSLRAQLAKVTAEYAPRQKSKVLEGEIVRTEAEMKGLRQAFDILQRGSAGSMSKGHAEYLRAFSRQVVSGLWLTGFTIEGDDVELRGRALHPELLPAFINRLKQEPIMHGKSFETLTIATPEAEPVRSEAAVVPPLSKQGATAGYIEFSLRSSGISAEPGDASGSAGRAIK